MEENTTNLKIVDAKSERAIRPGIEEFAHMEVGFILIWDSIIVTKTNY